MNRAARAATLTAVCGAVVVIARTAATTRAIERQAAAGRAAVDEFRRALDETHGALVAIEARLDELGRRDDDLADELREASEELTRTIVSLHAHVTGWSPVDG